MAVDDSPYGRWEARLEAAERATPNAVGTMLVQGARDGDEDHDDEGERPVMTNQQLTEAQVGRIRLVIVSQDLKQRLDQAEELLLGEQYGEEILMFDTAFGDDAMDCIDWTVREFPKLRDWNQRLNHLLASTDVLNRHDCWLHGHESGWGGEEPLEAFAALWRSVLQQSSASLGIDDEFTRPAVQCLLRMFAAKVREGNDEDMYDEPVAFAYEP